MSDDITLTDQDNEDIDQVLVTKDGLKLLQEELKELKTSRRSQVAERLKEAISYGDLSENSEYEEAKNEQAFIEGRILELEKQIKNVKIIDDKSGQSVKIVQVGSTVDIVSSVANSEVETYTIVGSTEADPFNNKISNESPVGKALIGHKKGDTVKVLTPLGELQYEIVKIS